MGDASPPPPEENILVLLPSAEPTESFEKIQKRHPNVRFTFRQVTFIQGKILAAGEIPDEIYEDATILVTLYRLPLNPKLAPNLKLVHLISAGVDRLQETPIWKETDITITNSSGIHSPQIAEWVILQILSHAHKERILIDWQKKHHWGKHTDLGDIQDGVGQRLGVLGYGAIGRQTARIAKSLGYDIIAYTATPKNTPESRKDRGYIVPGTGDPDGLIPSEWYSGLDKASLHNFLSKDIDILLVSVPLTKETTYFLGAEEFAILGKKNAFIANIARGKVLQQDDLIAALKKEKSQGGLRGAALDVTDPEPLPVDSKLWELKNIAVTPHISGLGSAPIERTFEILEKNLTNMEEGKRLINVVDRKKGY